MARKVTLYTDDRDYSNLARSYLKENNIMFEEINISEKRDKPITMNSRRIPFLIVKGSSGVHTVTGFDEFQYASALNTRLSYDKWVEMKKENQRPLSYKVNEV